MTGKLFLRTVLAGSVAATLAVTMTPTAASAARLDWPAAPVVAAPADGATQVGKPAQIAVSKGAGGEMPVRYGWRLDGTPLKFVAADAGGEATISLSPRRFISRLEVFGVSAAGHIGDSVIVLFNSNPGDLAGEGDLTGDGHTDLVFPGGAHGVPSGLWLGRGDGAGGLAPTVTNLGPRGVFGNDPSDFDNTQISVGRFAGGSFQDVFLYSPDDGNAAVIRGSGDGAPIQDSNDVSFINRGILLDNNGFDPIQVVRGGTRAGVIHPDLIGTAGNEASGYYVNYFPNMGSIVGYGMVYSLTTPTPAGDLAWNTWTLASTATADGTATLFLWQRTTGKLYAWRNLTFDGDTQTLSYTEQHLADAFYPGQSVTLQAADINGDETADLWAVGPAATATPWTITQAGALTQGTARPLVPAQQ